MSPAKQTSHAKENKSLPHISGSRVLKHK